MVAASVEGAAFSGGDLMSFAMWHVWLIAGLVLLIAEIFTTGFAVGVFGIACFAAAIGAAFGLSFEVQLLCFGIASGTIALAIRPLVLRCFASSEVGSSTNVDALIGRSGFVTEEIDPKANTGRLKLAGEEWKAASFDETAIEAGSGVIVRRVEGCTLFVERLENQGRTI